MRCSEQLPAVASVVDRQAPPADADDELEDPDEGHRERYIRVVCCEVANTWLRPDVSKSDA